MSRLSRKQKDIRTLRRKVADPNDLLRPFMVVAGASTVTTCKLAAFSFLPGDVYVTFGGRQVRIPLTERCADSDPGVTLNWYPLLKEVGTTTTAAGYSGSAIVSDLSEWVAYPYTARQMRNEMGTISGTFRTAPRDTDRFIVVTAGCDHVEAPGAYLWTCYRRLAEKADPPIAAVVFADDLGYVDASAVIDNNGGFGHTTPISGTSAYKLMLGYMALFGLPFDHVFYVGEGYDSRWEDRLWCLQNLNFLPQFGDHEFRDNMGFNGNPSDDVRGTPTWHSSFVRGKLAWDSSWGLLCPPMGAEAGSISASGDTGCYNWGIVLGSLNIVAPDCMTNSDFYEQSGTQFFGAQQITDTLTWFSSKQKIFNLLYSSFAGLKPLIGTNGGAHQPMYRCTPNEYKALLTDATRNPPSFMGCPYTNGELGVGMFGHGDFHHQSCGWNHLPADPENNILAEGFFNFENGSTTGSGIAGIGGHEAGPDEGEWEYNGCRVLYNDYARDMYENQSGAVLTIEGTTSLRVDLINRSLEIAWSGTFMPGDNAPQTWSKGA